MRKKKFCVKRNLNLLLIIQANEIKKLNKCFNNTELVFVIRKLTTT